LASYYEILGVDEQAPHDLIKRQFLERSLRFQRERAEATSSDALERVAFRQREVDEAWTVLRSPADRARYDEELRATRGRSTTSVRRNHGIATSEADDLPVLEVLDVGVPVEATAETAASTVSTAPTRTRRWRFFATFLAIVVGAGTIAVTGGWGGRAVGAASDVRTVSDSRPVPGQRAVSGTPDPTP
jgi:curved DNA-binding protein CbpA